MGMFDNLMGGDDSNPISVLKELLNPENIELKTDLNIGQIQVMVQMNWFSLLKSELKKPESERRSISTLMMENLTYFQMLLCSIERKREAAIVKGISEMKESLFMPDFMVPGVRNKK